MAITVSGKLNKAAKEKQLDNGDFQFFVGIGKRERDFKTKENVWVNYQASLFAKAGKQAEFYRDVLQQDAIITVNGTGLLPRIWGDNNDQVSLSILDSKLEYAFNPNQSQQAPAPQAPAPVTAAPQAQAAPANSFSDFDDDIPF